MARPGDYADATCAACDSTLDRGGLCTNEECGYSFCHQDDPSGWRYNQERKRKPAALGQFEAGSVIANTKTKTYRLPGDRGYAKAKGATHAVYFRCEEDAARNGYRRREGG